MPVGQGGISPYLSPIVRGAVPLLYNLMAGNTISPGNTGGLGGSLGGSLGGYLGGPYGGLFGGYGGNVLGSVAGGGSLGPSALRGISSLGIGLLNLLLPNELRGFGSVAAPLTTSLLQLGGNAIGQGLGLGSNILGPAAAGWGGAVGSAAGGTGGVAGAGTTGLLGTIGNYAGPIGMVAAAIYNILGELSAEGESKAALREIEGQILAAYKKASPYVDPLYQQLSQYIPEAAKKSPSWVQQMTTQPEWAQPLLAGGQGIHSETSRYPGPLMLFTSPSMQTFNDPQLKIGRAHV